MARNFWTSEELELLKNHYDGTRSIMAMIKGRSWKTIKDKASDLGLGNKANTYTAIKIGFANGTRVGNKKYKYNDSAFSQVTPESAYWAGFIAADGCVCVGKNGIPSLQITLSSVDVNILEEFRHFMLYDGPIHKHTTAGRNEQSRIILNGCTRIAEDLKSIYNIIPNKTLTLEPPNLVQDNHIRSFISGYIDGDGCIRINDRGIISLTVLGTKSMMLWIRQWFDFRYPKKRTNKLYKPPGQCVFLQC